MEKTRQDNRLVSLPRLSQLPVSAKALLTAIICTLMLAMAGALGQIVVHDIIPTFFTVDPAKKSTSAHPHATAPSAGREAVLEDTSRGDLFRDAPAEHKAVSKPAFYLTDQFVWMLKWTHIHLFGMNMIFIFMGGITLLLDLKERRRTWLVVLPFIAVLVDIGTVWLKGYLSPAFFWLHVPAGALFGGVFMYVSIRALREMWLPQRSE